MACNQKHSALSGAKVLVTGGAGLVGSALARRLIDLGCEVLLVDNLNESFGGNLFNIHSTRAQLNISDIRDDHGMRYLLQGQDYIFNLAAQTSHMDSMHAPFEDLEINCTAQLSLMEMCRTLNPGARIIYASTRQVYGRPQYLPVDERHPICPLDVNGINKVSGESFHLLYHRVHDLQTTVLRLTNTYGPGMRIKDARQIFLGIWFRRLIEGEPFEVWGGDQLRDFTFVGDAAEAFLAAAQSPATIGGVFNVGGCDPVSLKDVADILVGLNGGGSYSFRTYPAERRKIDIGDYYTNDLLFRSLTNWAPSVELREGLRRTLEFYRANIDRYV
jgi:UDP-glucose 4-epimerase